MGSIADHSAAAVPMTPRADSRRRLLRYLADRWLRHCAETVERDIRWLGHDGVLADFSRASHG
jgi:hypothetical protein